MDDYTLKYLKVCAYVSLYLVLVILQKYEPEYLRVWGNK